MNKYEAMINATYSYVNEAEDPDECVTRLGKALNFMIRLHQSYVDNDKPRTNNEINMEILQQVELSELHIPYVSLEEHLE